MNEYIDMMLEIVILSVGEGEIQIWKERRQFNSIGLDWTYHYDPVTQKLLYLYSLTKCHPSNSELTQCTDLGF